ncbi:MAG TPA: ABC transporter permease [Vicinamibacterales bacterium]|nr:ABC transporter permease [Vicinamibacterales bacterium]
MSGLWRDLQYGMRLLLRQRAFSGIAVAVLALGIGANSAAFGLVNALLLKPRPGRTAGQVVGLYSRDRTQPDSYRGFSYPNYADLRAHSEVFRSLTAHTFAFAGITEGAATRRVFVNLVTANFFDTFGVSLERGRPFTVDEERPGANVPVAILSHAAWRRMGAPGDVIGRTIRLNGRPFEIVGVAPKGFGGSMALVTPELWIPTGVYDSISNDFVREGLPGTLADRGHHTLVAVARLAPGATIASAAPALAAVGGQLALAFPADNHDQELSLAPLARLSVGTRPQSDGEIVGVAGALLTMSGVVLLIASFNLANMLLARGTSRRKEMAIRLAIGGSRARIARQLLTEGAVLSLLGGAAGLVLAMAASRALVAMLAPISPVALSFDGTPDVRVFAATVGFAMLGALVFGALPAWTLSRTQTVPGLRDQAGDLTTGRRSRFRMQNMLVMAQLGFSLVMVATAGMFLRGATLAAGADPGFTLDRGILMQIDASLASYGPDRARPLYQRVLSQLRARPEVVAASLAGTIPFGDFSDGQSVQRAGAPIPPGDPRASAELIPAEFTTIGSDYFRSLGLTILRGRDFSPSEEEAATGEPVAIIDEPLSRRLFGSEDPIGQRVQYAVRDQNQPPLVLRVVGLVPGVRQDLFDAAPGPHLYVPFGREFRSSVFVHARTSLPSAEAESALLPGVRRLVREVDPALPVLSLETRPMFRERNLGLAIVRVGANIFAAFGGVALFLATVGVYGVKAYVVSRRTREIGIRVALGATPGAVVRMVVREGALLAGIGLLAGGVLSIATGAALRNMAYEGRGVDGVVLAAAVVTLLLATFLAAWLPARRATRVPPTLALRAD